MATESGTGLLVVWTDIAPEAEAEFNEWYNNEHIPQLLGVKGFLSGKRYQAVDGKPRYLAVYEMREDSIPKTPEWDKARNYGRTAQIRPGLRDLQAVTARRIYPA